MNNVGMMYFSIPAKIERDPVLFDTWMDFMVESLPITCAYENAELLPGPCRRYKNYYFENDTVTYAWPIARKVKP